MKPCLREGKAREMSYQLNLCSLLFDSLYIHDII